MFYKKDDAGYVERLPGVSVKTLTYGDKSSIAEIILKKGSVVPMHKHVHEQTGYMVKGKLRFIIEGEETITEAGDSWNVLSNVEHMAEALEDSVVIDVFTPVREEYL